MGILGAPLQVPQSKVFARLSIKFSILLSLVVYLLGYQPTIGFPPVKKAVVHAQAEQQQDISAEATPLVFQLPHPGYLSTYFSKYHPGVDIATGLGMPIKPISQGSITEAGYNFWGLGMTVVVNHGYGFESLYGHMGRIYVKKGDEVSKNNFLGEVGLTGFTTGPHTHLEIRKDGKEINPLLVLPQIKTMPVQEDFKPAPKPSAASKLDLTKQIQASL